ncbi:MAG: aminoglycoside phosphotransferase family protein, partial [Mucilaginibacter sp.]|nr:aminoglycoside phosphotransferase family protein [Mucilaginibacter sp.]
MDHTIPINARIFSLISEFKIDAKIASVKPFGSGHINDTYHIINSDAKRVDYLLQRINHYVFRDVPALMQNLLNVTNHLKQKLSLVPGANTEKEVLTIVETRQGLPYFKD